MNHTITHSLDDDVESVREEKMPREHLVRRLLENFVFVPTTAAEATDRRLGVLLLAGEGDEGMFLPIFTSPDHFAQTPLSQQHVVTRVPFDALMRQISPETGLVINPMTPRAYSIRWFVLQEYVPEFGADLLKQEVTPEWLSTLNDEFNRSEMPHGKRAYEAIERWNQINGFSISLSSARARQIFEWFASNIKPGSDWIGPLAAAAFYHGGAFWETTVPLAFGQPTINPLDVLRMPASVKLDFCRERNDIFVFLKFFGDLYDYYYTVDDLRESYRENPLLRGFIGAGRQHLTSAATFLLETRPNPKAAQESRTALEIFLKVFLVHRANTDEKELRNLSHDLRKLLRRCLEIEPKSELRQIEDKLGVYPDISARYRADQFAARDLWVMYNSAVTAGVTAMRPMGDRDFRVKLTVMRVCLSDLNLWM